MENRAEMNEKVEKGRRHKSEQTVTAVSGRRRADFMAMTGLRLNHSAALRQERLCCRHDPCHTLRGEGRCPVRRPAPPRRVMAQPAQRLGSGRRAATTAARGGDAGRRGRSAFPPPSRGERAEPRSGRLRSEGAGGTEPSQAGLSPSRPVPSRQRLLVGGAIGRRLGGESEVGSWGVCNGERLVGLGV